MTHAYNKIYLDSVMRNVGAIFDIAINAMGREASEFASRFADSDLAKGIEAASPNILAGKSPTEMLSELFETIIPYDSVPMDRSPEYWAGWILALSQWYFNRSFKEILTVVSFGEIINRYYPYHEADEMKTIEWIEDRFRKESALKRIRIARKLSQSQLSELSGVKLRSIQCYEQGDIDIRNAQADTLYALAKTLDCSIEDLIK